LLSNFVIFIDFHYFIGFYFCLRLSILPVVLLAYLSREKDIGKHDGKQTDAEGF
jgi:hypothetical protein